jgi:cellulose synthase/poly-beta-1,6-N-acetylglucosamine synthase-like glycosyltransferase
MSILLSLLPLLISVGRLLIIVLQAVLLAQVGYLLLLTVAAVFAPRRTAPRQGLPTTRFIILVPAHNEEQLIERTVNSLLHLDYPAALFAVHVIADNCTDRTADLARHLGAIVHERSDPNLRGKGYALEWALQRLWANGAPCDAVVIIDADTDVSHGFLTVMDARLSRDERVIQAYYAVRDPGRAWGVTLRFVALAVLHFLRPQGRVALGASVGLKGNGMVFSAEMMRRQHWSASLTEDVELHLRLVLDGVRVTFAPDAMVAAEMPDTLARAQSQNARWERGRLQMVRTYVPSLLRQAWAQRSFVLFDAAVEQLTPPTSMLAFLIVFSLMGAAALGAGAGVIVGGLLLLAMLIYILAGLCMVHAPAKAYYALFYAPVLVVWKVWLYVRVLLSTDRQGWVRTARNTEAKAQG